MNENRRILTKGTTCGRQSRDRDLDIATRAVGVCVHSNSPTNSSISPVRQHSNVLCADRVVLHNGSLVGGFSSGRDIAGSIAVGSRRRAWSTVARCIHSRRLSAGGVYRRRIAAWSLGARCVRSGSFRAVGGRGIRSSRRVISRWRIGSIRSSRSIIGRSMILRKSKDGEERQEQYEETHGRSRRAYRGSVTSRFAQVSCPGKCFFAGAESGWCLPGMRVGKV
jgi:hypothetical protein